TCLLATMLLLGIGVAQNTTSPPPSPPPDAGITREQAAKIVQELQLIRMLLEDQHSKQAGAPTGDIAAVQQDKGLGTTRIIATPLGERTLGRSTAPLTLVEFVDFQCPFCMRFHQAIMPELKRKYIESGRLRFVAMDFPLDSHS